MAVYTKLLNEDIERLLTNYEIGYLLEFQEIIDGIDNSNYLLKTNKGKFILTIFESRIDKNQLPFFIEFKAHLSQKKISCPRPILDNKGFSIAILKEKKSIITSFLSGKNLKPREDGYYYDITKDHCFEVGKALARIHLAAADFSLSRENELGVKGWRNLFFKFEHLLENYQKNLAKEILQEIDFLEKSWRFDLQASALHLDLFPDNVFFDENKKISGVIDFYFAANDLLIYDFAITVNAWCFDEKNIFLPEKYLALKMGYESLRKFSDVEFAFLKTALIGGGMRILLTRLHDMFFTPKDSVVKIKDPQEYLAKIRFFKNNDKTFFL